MTQKTNDLKLEAYDFELPQSFIAQRPLSKRDDSKLLVFNNENNETSHEHFFKLCNYLPRNSTLVLNQSQVYPCRLIGKKSTGGKCEIFVLNPSLNSEQITDCLIKTSGKKKLGDEFRFDNDLKACLTELSGDGTTFKVKFNKNSIIEDLNSAAQIPIPPYIRGGESDDKDRLDYQTVYSKEQGSVAAPTAGLHFTPELLNELKDKGVNIAYVTLHVGLGTFLPVSSSNILEHKMHQEFFYIDQENLDLIKNSKKIFAVGTTSLRVLESIHNKEIQAHETYSTDIFLHPGKEIQSIDGLITNFHLPKSSLLMLVSALIGREKTLELYEVAKENNYRFFSYGDAMLIQRNRV